MARSIKVLTVIIKRQSSPSNIHGYDLYVSRTQRGLDRRVAQYCRDNWGDLGKFSGVPTNPPTSDKQCIMLYFENAENEYVEYGQDWI